jgi:hypothetical protein
MSKFAFFLLCSISGGVCASANVDIHTWQYWVILLCVLGSYVCGAIRND